MSNDASNDDSLWKLADARCMQLRESVSAARVPFLLALTWSFIWAWTLYSADLGYINTYHERLEKWYALSIDASRSAEFETICKEHLAGALYETEPNDKLARGNFDTSRQHYCQDILNARLKWSENAILGSYFVSFPGGLGTTSVADLGVMGQAGLLLILLWLFYASRRENHAILSFVDIDGKSRKLGYWFPQILILEPQGVLQLSSKHLAYSYQAVAQRFVFIFSTHSRPLFMVTMLLGIIPASVATWNFYTDLRDFFQSSYSWEPSISARIMVEGIFQVLVWLVTIRCLRLVVSSGILLNAWYLASRDVWEKEWNSSGPAFKVSVNVQLQEATQIKVVIAPNGGV